MQLAISLGIIIVVTSVCSFIAVVGIALIALGSSGVFKSSTSSNTPTTSNTAASSTGLSISLLNNASIYPNGSFLQLLSSFSQASNTLALTALNQSILDQYGRTDNSSSIFEAGRLQYLYFQLPSGWSGARSVRSVPLSEDEKNTNHPQSRASRATSNVITGIAIHFGPAGSDNSVVVIPLPDFSNNHQTPGITTLNQTDGSMIIRADFVVPSLVCPSSSGTTVNACQNVTYQAYSVVDHTTITSFLSADVNVACGDVCALSSSVCSSTCTTCNGEQVAGADTPVSRRYTMTATAGKFLFDYQTYVIKDRITVWNAGNLIFDTGCVGANDTVYISYSSSSSSIRVDVEPNCACTSSYGCYGTAWYFTVFCLNTTNTRQAAIISSIHESKGAQIVEGNALVITTVEGKPYIPDKDHIE